MILILLALRSHEQDVTGKVQTSLSKQKIFGKSRGSHISRASAADDGTSFFSALSNLKKEIYTTVYINYTSV